MHDAVGSGGECVDRHTRCCKGVDHQGQRLGVVCCGGFFRHIAKPDRALSADARHGARQDRCQILTEYLDLERRRSCIEDKDHFGNPHVIAASATEAIRAAAGSARDVSKIGTLAPVTIPAAQPPLR